MQTKRQLFSPIKQRILQFVDLLDISKREFYAKTNVSRGTLESSSGINEETLSKIIAVYRELSPTWLITGKGKMILDSESTHLTLDLGDGKSGVPVYESLPVSAGDITSFLDDSTPAGYLSIPQVKDCIAILPVYGSSMKGVIEPGDLIAIKEIRSRNEFDPSIPYMVITDEHRMIKYLHMDPEDESLVWAESTNHAKIKLHVDNIKTVYAIKCVIRFF